MSSAPALRILLLLGLAFGCQELPHQPRGHDVEVIRTSPELDQANPTDVAVLPLKLVDPALVVPAEELRLGFQKALLARRYSPLALAAVDSRVVEASYRAGDLREDAVLEISVEKWDASLWSVSEQIGATVSARLIEAQGAGRVLWEGRLDRTLHGYEVVGNARNKADSLQALCNLFAGDLLAALPARKVAVQ